MQKVVNTSYTVHSSGAPLNVVYFNCIVQAVVWVHLECYTCTTAQEKKIQRAFHGISVHLKFHLDGNVIKMFSAQSFQIICILHVFIVD